MYKRIKGKKFKRTTDQRRAFLRALAANLILREKIKTTKVRAKAAAREVERYITKAKKNDLPSRRYLESCLPRAAAARLVSEIAPRFVSRQGGYTRVVKLGQRAKDGSQIAVVEFTEMAKIKDEKNGKKGAKAKKSKKDKKTENQKVAKSEDKEDQKI